MADDGNPMDSILGGMIGGGGSSRPAAEPKADRDPTASVVDETPQEPAATPTPAASSSSRQARSRKSTSRPQRRATASSFPSDWIPVQVSVPEEANNRAGSQMRPRRVGLKPGEGKTAGRRYALSIKLAAVDQFLGSDLDTSGFVFGNEKQSIAQVEDAILAKAERILADRASREAA